MSNHLGRARRALTTAHGRSCDARDATDADGRAARRALAVAERGLRDAGRDAPADRLARIADVTTADARSTVRGVMTVLDAERNPSVNAASFAPASERGGAE